MKTAAIITSLLWFFTNLEYTFDYRLEYDLINPKNQTVSQINYYINSQDNSYYGALRVSKKSGYDFYFRDQDKLTAIANLTGNYKKPGTITFEENLTSKYTNIYEYKAKNYDIHILSDTLLGGKQYSRFLFQSIDKKRAKQKKIGTHIYIIDTSKKMKPLLSDSAPLNIWRLKNKMPHGLVVEKLVYNSNGELAFKEKLKEIDSVNFKIFIK